MLLEAATIATFAELVVDAHKELSNNQSHAFLRRFLQDDESTNRFMEDVKKVIEQLDIKLNLRERIEKGNLDQDDDDSLKDFLMDRIAKMILDADPAKSNPFEIGVLGPTNLSLLMNLPQCTVERAIKERAEGEPKPDPPRNPIGSVKSSIGFWIDDDSLPALADGNEGEARRVFVIAMNKWTKALRPVNVRLKAVPPSRGPEDAHVIVFGDSIDVRGAKLAVADVGPPRDEGPQLRLRFDKHENFAIFPVGNQKSFLHVALHELGHILGLSHAPGISWDPDAVMFGSYTGPYKHKLTTQDKDAVVDLWS